MFTFVLMRMIAVVLLVAANAFFAAGEYALVSIRDTRLEQLIDEGRLGARTIRKLHNKLDEVLNGIQIGVTMASLALGWLGEESLAACCWQPLGKAAARRAVCPRAGCRAGLRVHHLPARHPRRGGAQIDCAAKGGAGGAGRGRAAGRIHHHLCSGDAHHGRQLALGAAFLRLAPIREGGVHTPEELKLSVTASHRYGLLRRHSRSCCITRSTLTR